MFSRRTSWKLDSNRFTLAHQQMLREGREVLDLTISNPTRAGFAFNETTILDALRNPKSLDYDPQPKGLRRSRETVAEYYKCGAGAPAREIDAENIVLTTSTSEGYSYVFRLLCNPEDEVLVPKPSYPLFDFLADLQDVRVVPYPLLYDHGWQIDLPTLEMAITPRTRAIVLVHPNNPTGSYVREEEQTRLNQLCREHNLALIVDEVFLDYAHDGRPQHSFATNNDAFTFTLSGLSKIAALPQMKLAWIVVSGSEKEATEAMHRLEVIADTYLSLNAPVQLAAETLLKQRKKIQSQVMTRIRANLAELDRQLVQYTSCVRLLIEGGWYAVLRVPVTKSDEDLAIEVLRERSVLVHPGHFYDFPSDGYLVLSLITPEATFREGISRVLKAF
ncbi:MAG: pyridoxal phosphate-dependent aminotransferase [Acidobacteria bacterium]|nr:MAG: pyridoxal phosphate-dependent aminotransferase [Acidobacteriota bacterium]